MFWPGPLHLDVLLIASSGPQVVEALHAQDDVSNIPLKPLEAMLSIDLAHPNIIHTYKFYTRIRQVRRACSHAVHPFRLSSTHKPLHCATDRLQT